jgi:hypothetical protein
MLTKTSDKEIYQAVTVKYTNDMNDPLAWKFKALLGSLNRQLHLEETRGLKDAILTDFFGQS